MEQIQVKLKFRGRVILDGVHKNSIQSQFLDYVREAFQGKKPLISYYQIYNQTQGVAQKATITKVEQQTNQIIITFQAQFTNTPPYATLYLQAVLSDGSIINIGVVTQIFNQSALSVTWQLFIILETTSNTPVSFNSLYEFLVNFFTNQSALTQQPPQLVVNYEPTNIPMYQFYFELNFVVAFNNVGSGPICPIVTYQISVYLLGFQVIQFAGSFLCVPLPNIYNTVIFSISV